MSCSNSIFGSIASENRWVVEMCNAFPREHAVDVVYDIPPYTYRVPKSLSETKPDAYAPQQVGLGPFHHLRPDLYTMQRKKLAAVAKFLNSEQQLQSFQLVVERLVQREYEIRSSYAEYLDLDPLTLAWILAIDAVYLMHLLKNHFAHIPTETARVSDMKKLAGDILMLENQIPLGFLLEVRRTLKLSSCGGGHDDEEAFCKDFSLFCQKESPLVFNESMDISYMMRQGHPLMVMYYLIVTNRGIKIQKFEFNKAEKIRITDGGGNVYANVKQGVEIAASLGLPGCEVAQKHISFMEKAPWDRILALFKTRDPEEENPLVEEIDIPSVSQLHQLAGIKFELTPGGIRDVKFDEGEKKFYLPVITLKSNSEVILRNLVAYEAASAEPGSTLELAEYVDLMCGIVDTPKDVEILRDAKIVKGDRTDAEIACIFNGIRKSTGDKDKMKTTTNIEKAIDKVNEQYDNTARVKTLRFIKRHVYRSWKFLTVLSTVMVLMLLSVQAFCEIYGCNKRWSKQ